MELQLAVEHVDAEEILGLLFGAEMLRGGGQFLRRHAAGMIPEIETGSGLLWKLSLHQEFRVLRSSRDLFRRDQPAHHQVPLLAEGDVLVYRDVIAICCVGADWVAAG